MCRDAVCGSTAVLCTRTIEQRWTATRRDAAICKPVARRPRPCPAATAGRSASRRQSDLPLRIARSTAPRRVMICRPSGSGRGASAKGSNRTSSTAKIDSKTVCGSTTGTSSVFGSFAPDSGDTSGAVCTFRGPAPCGGPAASADGAGAAAAGSDRGETSRSQPAANSHPVTANPSLIVPLIRTQGRDNAGPVAGSSKGLHLPEFGLLSPGKGRWTVLCCRTFRGLPMARVETHS